MPDVTFIVVELRATRTAVKVYADMHARACEDPFATVHHVLSL
jgi:hypothetical protein